MTAIIADVENVFAENPPFARARAKTGAFCTSAWVSAFASTVYRVVECRDGLRRWASDATLIELMAG
jgi:hypothetical protein